MMKTAILRECREQDAALFWQGGRWIEKKEDGDAKNGKKRFEEVNHCIHSLIFCCLPLCENMFPDCMTAVMSHYVCRPGED
jgi:hypothetical protein